MWPKKYWGRIICCQNKQENCCNAIGDIHSGTEFLYSWGKNSRGSWRLNALIVREKVPQKQKTESPQYGCLWGRSLLPICPFTASQPWLFMRDVGVSLNDLMVGERGGKQIEAYSIAFFESMFHVHTMWRRSDIRDCIKWKLFHSSVGTCATW